MSNVLIAYFSHDGEAYVNGKVTELETGNTRVAAGMLKELTGAEVYRIETVSGYPHSYMKTIEIAKREKQENARPALKGELPDLSGYSTLILAHPNWWGTMPMAVFRFLYLPISIRRLYIWDRKLLSEERWWIGIQGIPLPLPRS